MPKNVAKDRYRAVPPFRLNYIHPVELLRGQLDCALQDASLLIELTLDNYEPYYYDLEGRKMCSQRLREQAYCNPREKYYPRARRSLELAMLSAIGIGKWLKWGMSDRAGTFETELRAALAGLIGYVDNFPALVFVPILRGCLARWKSNLDQAVKLADELEPVAIESHDPTEWEQALYCTLQTIKTLFDAFVTFHKSAQDPKADLIQHKDHLLAFMKPFRNSLATTGPRLLYAEKESEDAVYLVEHLPTVLTQFAGNLQYWRSYEEDATRRSPGTQINWPSDFMRAWHGIKNLGDLIARMLGLSLPNEKEPPVAPPKKRQRVAKNDQADFAQAREDAIAEKIRNLAQEGKQVTSSAVAAKCSGVGTGSIPAGTVRCSKAWKRRDDIIAKVGGDVTYLDKYRNVPAFASDQEPLDESE